MCPEFCEFIEEEGIGCLAICKKKNKEIELIWAILQQNIEKLYILDQIKKSI